jgi:hypothetical protein
MNSQDLHNLQEAYMEVYDNELSEGYKKFPYKKVEDKIHKKESDNPTGRGTPQSVKMGTVFRHFKGGKEVRRSEKREHSPQISKAKEKENRARGTQKEQVDLYDIILSHLLDEGYAETPQAAEAIMVNMSEDWRESIMEAMKPLPVGKMKSKIENIKSSMKSTIEKSANEVGINPKRVRYPFAPDDREKYSKDEKRVANISKSLNKDK